MVRSLSFIIQHLAKMGQPKLANKILKAIKDGSTANLKASELSAFNVIRHELMKTYRKNAGIVKSKGPHDVQLRRELKYSPPHNSLTGKRLTPGGGGALSRAYYTSSKNVPMIDIDLPSPWHTSRQIIFNSRGEALGNLKEFLKSSAGKNTAFKAYDTPGGVRLFDISRKGRGISPKDYKKRAEALGNDPAYLEYSIPRGRWDARIMPKPGRKGDYIAKPLKGDYRKIIKGADADISKRSYDEVTNIHDALMLRILHNKLKSGNISLGGMLDYVNLLKSLK